MERSPSKNFKKALVPTLCSAFVVPGLGQILNQEIKKGLILMGSVFVLFLVGIMLLVRLVRLLLESGQVQPQSAEEILLILRQQDPWMLYGLGAAFFLVWIVAVVDACLGGLRVERRQEEGPL